MDWARVEFLYDCFSYALAQLWLLWKPPKRPILGRADGKACVLCANPQWQQVYFGHALGCDMPILEALWCALEPKSLQAIWQELADKAQFDDRPWDDLRPYDWRYDECFARQQRAAQQRSRDLVWQGKSWWDLLPWK